MTVLEDKLVPKEEVTELVNNLLNTEEITSFCIIFLDKDKDVVYFVDPELDLPKLFERVLDEEKNYKEGKQESLH